MADAACVADRVPGSKLVTVSSIVELRLRADRYAKVVGAFLSTLPA